MGKSAPPKKKVKDFGAGPPEGNNILSCEICNVNVTSSQQLDAHMIGQKHKKKVKALAELEAPTPTVVIPGTSLFLRLHI